MGSWVRVGRGFSLYLLYRNRYFFCRTFNVHKALSMLEDVGEFEEASIYIEPPPVAANTDEDSALIMQLMINQGLRLSDGVTTTSSMLRHMSIGRPRGFASSANRVPEQIRFDRLDHLVQP